MQHYDRLPQYYDPKELERQKLIDKTAALRTALGYAIGKLGNAVGPSNAARQCNVSVDVAKYWMRKVRDPAFHPGTWGGRRDNQMRFGGVEGDIAAQVVLYTALEANPQISFSNLHQLVRTVPGMEDISTWWISTRIKGWRWNWKRMARFAKQKFTPANRERYLEYCVNIVDYPFEEVRK